MIMLGNNTNIDLNDGPHTLRSGIHSPGISIPRPHHSVSFISNLLEISQSPTRVLIQEPHNSQVSVLDTQPSCTTSVTNESACCQPASTEIASFPCTANQEKIQPLSTHMWSANKKNEEIVSKDKNTDGQILVPSSQTFPSPPNSNLPELPHVFSPGATVCKSNLRSEPTTLSSCKPVPGASLFSSSDMLPSYSPISSHHFFSFVIFHAPEDQEIASRVCKVLESLGVCNGTTYCEGFETAGVSPLTCLENAVENSAYIILLLTNAFLEAAWGGVQSTTAMMNSIQSANKLGSVIPFYPSLSKPACRPPLWIRALVPLDEKSPTFEAKVRNTFKSKVIRDQYEHWSRSKKKTTTEFQQQNISLQWPMDDTTAVLPQQTQPPLSVYHGQPAVIQISHANNVQIGNQNSMNVQFSPNGPQMDWDTNMYPDTEYETPN